MFQTYARSAARSFPGVGLNVGVGVGGGIGFGGGVWGGSRQVSKWIQPKLRAATCNPP